MVRKTPQTRRDNKEKIKDLIKDIGPWILSFLFLLAVLIKYLKYN